MKTLQVVALGILLAFGTAACVMIAIPVRPKKIPDESVLVRR